MKWLISFLLIIGFATGCTSVPRNATSTRTDIAYPAVGVTATARVGDRLVKNGISYESDAIEVKETIVGTPFTIPAGVYSKIGSDEETDFYSSNGVKKDTSFWYVRGLSVQKGQNSKICVVREAFFPSCYEGNLEKTRSFSENERYPQKTLIYNGRVGNRILIGYREQDRVYRDYESRIVTVSSNNLEYDLNLSNQIRYQEALIEVVNADSQSLTYKVIRHFD